LDVHGDGGAGEGTIEWVKRSVHGQGEEKRRGNEPEERLGGHGRGGVAGEGDGEVGVGRDVDSDWEKGASASW
jgi:hypothetical protein